MPRPRGKRPGKRRPVWEDIVADHATVARVKNGYFKGKILRSQHPGIRGNIFYSLAHSIAHLLYPKNFAEQIASKDRENTVWREKKLDEKSALGITSYYKGSLPGKEEHCHRVVFSDSAARLRSELMKNGLSVNIHYANIGFSPEGDPIFFELYSINPAIVEKKVLKMKDSEEKRQLAALLAALKKLMGKSWPSEWNDWIEVHV